VIITLRPLYLRGKRSRCPLDTRPGGPQGRSGRCPARSLSLYRLRYPIIKIEIRKRKYNDRFLMGWFIVCSSLFSDISFYMLRLLLQDTRPPVTEEQKTCGPLLRKSRVVFARRANCNSPAAKGHGRSHAATRSVPLQPTSTGMPVLQISEPLRQVSSHSANFARCSQRLANYGPSQ
jgi:hypothetical protein